MSNTYGPTNIFITKQSRFENNSVFTLIQAPTVTYFISSFGRGTCNA
ncbi:hypothetical protein VCHA43P277_50097 [Vibrio chagasii]|nr:hypothetical protein VCHA37O173_20428 [Vibrio chagasii]CAH6901988.1 hypothetical protein VCHA34P126_20187 [Vibrio chagasii]CAH7291004.1 hypothetical protein VCHA43P277_50097 [Vibrio chagasii]CAH7417665.1 hypothetical protein VCHA50P420_20210 [Vibrio chagasii]